MTAAIATLGAWGWLVAGLLLLALEIVAPGTVFLWFGLAALATGVVALLVPLPWQAEAVLFAVLAAASLAVWWRLRRRGADDEEDAATLNRRAGRHVGRRFVLSEPIVSGTGRVRIDDTVWLLAGGDLPAGTEVVVAAVDGTRLRVEPAAGASASKP